MVDLIPRKVLFGNPERVSPRLSPDGTRLAWIAPKDGVLNVWLAPVSPQSGVDWDQAEVVTDDADRGIRQFAWAHDNRHLLYLQDTGGDENWRLHDVDLTTMQRRDLTPFDGVQTQIVAIERDFPTEILIGLNKDNPELHDVYRLDLSSGELTKEVDNPGFIGWLADTKLVVRGAFRPLPDGSIVALVRDGADDDWRELLTIPADDALTTDAVTFSADGQSLLLVSSVGAETAQLVRFDLTTGEQTVLAADDEADISGVRVDPDTREPQIVVVLKDRSEYLVLDPSVADDLAAIRALHHGDPSFVELRRRRDNLAGRVHQRHGPCAVLRLRPGDQAGQLPVRAPASPEQVHARADGAVLLRRPRRADRARLRDLPARRPARRPADRAQRPRRPVAQGHLGLSTLRPSGWPTAAICACRSTSAARPATGRRSSTPATASGARRCRTT